MHLPNNQLILWHFINRNNDLIFQWNNFKINLHLLLIHHHQKYIFLYDEHLIFLWAYIYYYLPEIIIFYLINLCYSIWKNIFLYYYCLDYSLSILLIFENYFNFIYQVSYFYYNPSMLLILIFVFFLNNYLFTKLNISLNFHYPYIKTIKLFFCLLILLPYVN